MQSGWLKGAALAVACAAAPAMAQDVPPQASKVKLTATGCIERADQRASRQALGTSVDSLTFVLINAVEGGSSSQAPAPVSQLDVAKMYRLEGELDVINPHVGHQVEIVGSVAAVADAAAPIGTAGARGATDVGVPPPLLQVESVKMLSSTCSSKR